MPELSSIQFTKFHFTPHIQTIKDFISLLTSVLVFDADPKASSSRNLTTIAVPWAIRENAEEWKLEIYCFTGYFHRAPFPIQTHTLYCEWTPGLTGRVLFLSLVSVLVSASQLDSNPSTI